MEQLGSFLEMGGYAAYVWPAYLAAAVIMLLLLLASLRRLRRNEALLRAQRGLRGRADLAASLEGEAE